MICADICTMVKQCETATHLAYDAPTKKLSYTNEAGTVESYTLTDAVGGVASAVWNAATNVLTITGTDGIARTVPIPFTAPCGNTSRGIYQAFPPVQGVFTANGATLFTATMSVTNDLTCPARMLAWFSVSAYMGGGVGTSTFAPELTVTINGAEVTDGAGSGYNAVMNYSTPSGWIEHDSGNFGGQWMINSNVVLPGVNTLVATIKTVSAGSHVLAALEAIHGGMILIAR